jgi:formamidopyrimidine-DNA glycosylase
MIAGRLHRQAPAAKLSGRRSLAAFDFPSGSLVLTEAGTKHRASLHVLQGEESLRSIDPGGIDIFSSDLNSFRAALSAENHTLKRALTDPRLVSGIGNAYSDEILHAAQLSPIALTQKLTPDEWERLFAATRHTIEYWVDRLGAEARVGFPEKVTAFRRGMAVHGRYGEPCPRCGDKVLRIRYANKETNYGRQGSSGSEFVSAVGIGLAADVGGTGGAKAPVKAGSGFRFPASGKVFEPEAESRNPHYSFAAIASAFIFR